MKPDGSAENDGTGGWSAATTLPAAIANYQDGDELRLSKGIHFVASIYSAQPYFNKFNGITMLGGYPGVSNDEEPSLDRYATIVSGDIGKDDVWMHVDPVTGNKEYLLNDGEPIYVLDQAAGTLNLPPAYTASYDCYYPVQYDASKKTISETPNNNIQRFYCDNRAGSKTFRFENFTITGFGGGSSTSAGFIDLSGANTGIFKKLAVIGCNNDDGGILDNNATGTHEYNDLVFKHCRVWGAGIIRLRASAAVCHVSDIDAEGLYIGRWSYTSRGSGQNSGAVISMQSSGSGSYISDVTASRIVYDGGLATTAEGTFAALLMNLRGSVTLTNLTANGCWSSSFGNNPLLRVDNGGSLAVAGLCITNCKSQVKVAASSSIAAGLVYFGDNSRLRFLTNSLFKDNEMSVEATGDVNFLTAAPVVCRQPGGYQTLVSGSMFDNNVCTFTGGAATIDASVSRALAYRVEATDNTCTFTVVNCSFAGASAGSDLVFSRSAASVTGCKRTSFVLDSIFSSTTAGYVPMKAFEANHLAVRNCIVPGMDTQASIANVELSGSNYYHDPMLVYDATKKVLVPSVNVNGLLTSSAYYYQTKFGNGLVSTNLYNVTMRNNNAKPAAMSTQYASLLSTYDGRSAGVSYGGIYPDALGVARPDGAKTLGAVQKTDYPAGNVVASTIGPAGAGTVSPASVTATDGSVTLTATAATGYSFSHWEDDNGQTIGSSASLTVTPSEYTHVKAVFGAPKTKITFSLDGKGTFDDNGEDTIAVEAEAQTAFPSVPAFTANPGWEATSTWTPALPSTVPLSDTTYTLSFLKDFKAVCFDTHATGKGDGTSWADACTDWATAMTLCGTAARSELRIRTGFHLITTTAAVVDGVQVKGGYTGEGDTRLSDPKATVLSGDVNGDDRWLYDDATDGGLVYDAVKGAFNLPNTDRTHKYQTIANNADNTARLLNAEVTDWQCTRGFGMDGFTATGFGRGATRGPVLSSGPFFRDFAVSNCVFIANDGANNVSPNDGGDQGVIAVSAPMTVVDCAFIGNEGTAIRGFNYNNSYPTPWGTGYLDCRRTLFANGFASGLKAHTVGIGIRFGSGAVSDCTFRDNYAEGMYYYGPGGCIGSEGTVKWVLNCAFENNRLEGGSDNGSYLPTIARLSLDGMVSNCLFRSNAVVGLKGGVSRPSILWCGFHLFRCSFVDNEVASTNSTVAAIVMNARNGAAYGNCTFAGNRVSTSYDGGIAALVSNDPTQNTTKFGFGQCTIADNDVDAIATGFRDMIIGFGNCILWNSAKASVTPLKAYSGKTVTGAFWSNTIKGYVPSDDTSITLGYDDGRTIGEDPQLAKLEYSDDGLRAYTLPRKNQTGRPGAGADVRIRSGLGTSFLYYQFLFKKGNGQWDAINEFGQNLTGTPLDWDQLDNGLSIASGKYIRGSVQRYAKNGLLLLVR